MKYRVTASQALLLCAKSRVSLSGEAGVAPAIVDFGTSDLNDLTLRALGERVAASTLAAEALWRGSSSIASS